MVRGSNLLNFDVLLGVFALVMITQTQQKFVKEGGRALS
jgi:hypothetical protein